MNLKTSKIIFLGGIHGVGKGYISNKICSLLDVKYLSASDLIKWSDISSDVKNKKVKHIPSTQEILINALSKYRMTKNNYLLDGHYCLLDSRARIKKVDIRVFKKINPVLFLIKTESPEIIKQRLEKRDDKNYNLSLITKMQEIELTYSNVLAKKLGVPHFEISSKFNESTILQIKDILNESSS